MVNWCKSCRFVCSVGLCFLSVSVYFLCRCFFFVILLKWKTLHLCVPLSFRIVFGGLWKVAHEWEQPQWVHRLTRYIFRFTNISCAFFISRQRKKRTILFMKTMSDVVNVKWISTHLSWLINYKSSVIANKHVVDAIGCHLAACACVSCFTVKNHIAKEMLLVCTLLFR